MVSRSVSGLALGQRHEPLMENLLRPAGGCPIVIMPVV